METAIVIGMWLVGTVAAPMITGRSKNRHGRSKPAVRTTTTGTMRQRERVGQ